MRKASGLSDWSLVLGWLAFIGGASGVAAGSIQGSEHVSSAVGLLIVAAVCWCTATVDRLRRDLLDKIDERTRR